MTKIQEVILLLINEANEKSPREIRLDVIQAKSLPISDIILLSNYIQNSFLDVSVFTYEDINLNELAILTTCSTKDRFISDFSVIHMESRLQISKSDLTKIAYLISENTRYTIQDILNDYERNMTLSGPQIQEYGISIFENRTAIATKLDSSWIVFDSIDPFNQDDLQDPIGPINPIAPSDPQMN